MDNQLTFAQLKELVNKLSADVSMTDDVVIAVDCCQESASAAHVMKAGMRTIPALGTLKAFEYNLDPQLRWMKDRDGITRKTLVFNADDDYVSRIFSDDDDMEDTEGE